MRSNDLMDASMIWSVCWDSKRNGFPKTQLIGVYANLLNSVAIQWSSLRSSFTLMAFISRPKSCRKSLYLCKLNLVVSILKYFFLYLSFNTIFIMLSNLVLFSTKFNKSMSSTMEKTCNKINNGKCSKLSGFVHNSFRMRTQLSLLGGIASNFICFVLGPAYIQ